MPYNNALGRSVSAKVRNLNQRHIQHENDVNHDDDNHKNDITSQLEFVVAENPEVDGGEGHMANTMHDLGYEAALGPSGEPVPRKRTRKVQGSGVCAGGVCGIGGALESLVDLNGMHGDPPETTNAKVTVQARKFDYEGGGLSGGGKSSRTKRNDIVRKVMLEQKLSLPEASKYVKAHNLYVK